MKNKYQEAFKRLKNDIERGNCDYNVEPYLNILQELVDKETPMKVIEKYAHKERDYLNECSFVYTEVIIGNCPNCWEDINENYTYCPNCGQKLDWSDEE